jgi:hypothetical protein
MDQSILTFAHQKATVSVPEDDRLRGPIADRRGVGDVEAKTVIGEMLHPDIFPAA